MTPPDVLCHEASNTPLGLLTAAVWGGQMSVVRHLAETYPQTLDLVDARESTPLHVACRQGRLDIVEYLAGIRPDFIDRLATVKTSVLWATCFPGYLDVAKYLVSLRPSLIRVVDGDGISPFWIACQQGNVDVARFLFEVDPHIAKLDNIYLTNPLRIASQMGQIETVKFLVTTCRLIPSKGDVAIARRRNHTGVVEYLTAVMEKYYFFLKCHAINDYFSEFSSRDVLCADDVRRVCVLL